LRVDLRGALGLLSLSCTASDVSDVRLQLPGETEAQSFAPPACLQPFEHGFAPGTQVVSVTALKGDQQLGPVTCHGDVAPGKLVAATCELNPAQ